MLNHLIELAKDSVIDNNYSADIRGLYEVQIEAGFPIRDIDGVSADLFNSAVEMINSVGIISVFDLMDIKSLTYTQASYILYELNKIGLIRDYDDPTTDICHWTV